MLLSKCNYKLCFAYGYVSTFIQIALEPVNNNKQMLQCQLLYFSSMCLLVGVAAIMVLREFGFY